MANRTDRPPRRSPAGNLASAISLYFGDLVFFSLGYSSVYWYIFKLKVGLLIGAAVLTALFLGATFWLFQRLFGSYAFEQRTIVLNNQPFKFSPAKVIRPLGWVLSVVFGLVYGVTVKRRLAKVCVVLAPTGN